MREITPALTSLLQEHVGRRSPALAPPYPIETYRELVEHVAQLSYLNKDHLLFYRGQAIDFQTRNGSSSFYPSIYRGDYSRKDAVEDRFALLRSAGRTLHRICAENAIQGHQDIGRRELVQWAILQHYEVCGTPLLDFTQSLRVACSFAQQDQGGLVAYIYLFGFPHITNRISVNSEHDLVMMRLLSISPPEGLRPYFQEGYLAGTADITTQYESKSELDFNRRLIAKFQIPNDPRFWGRGLSRMSEEELYPRVDRMKDLCRSIVPTAVSEQSASALGEFVRAWTAVEQVLVAIAGRTTSRPVSTRNAILALQASGTIEPWIANALDRHRDMRNQVVHGKREYKDAELRLATEELRQILAQLPSPVIGPASAY